MSELSKVSVVLLRIQAACFLVMGLIQWAVIVVMLLTVTFRETPGQLENFEFMLLLGGIYFIAGFALYTGSRPLARFFVASLEGKARSES